MTLEIQGGIRFLLKFSSLNNVVSRHQWGKYCPAWFNHSSHAPQAATPSTPCWQYLGKTWPIEARIIPRARCLRFTDYCDMEVIQEESRAVATEGKQPCCLDRVRVPTLGSMSSHCLHTAVKLTSKPAYTGWTPPLHLAHKQPLSLFPSYAMTRDLWGEPNNV